jgi:predicted GTPase
MRVLDGIKAPLEAVAQLSTTQASQWLKSIGDLEALAKPTRTIVGVVGNTGAGKSSVISAVLDEERYTGPALA